MHVCVWLGGWVGGRVGGWTLLRALCNILHRALQRRMGCVPQSRTCAWSWARPCHLCRRQAHGAPGPSCVRCPPRHFRTSSTCFRLPRCVCVCACACASVCFYDFIPAVQVFACACVYVYVCVCVCLCLCLRVNCFRLPRCVCVYVYLCGCVSVCDLLQAAQVVCVHRCVCVLCFCLSLCLWLISGCPVVVHQTNVSAAYIYIYIHTHI